MKTPHHQAMWRRRESISKKTSSTQQQKWLDIVTSSSQSMSIISCQFVSCVVICHITIVDHVYCNQMYYKVEVQRTHMNMKSHVSWKVIGSWIVMRVAKESQGGSISPRLFIPPNCMSKWIFTLAPPARHWRDQLVLWGARSGSNVPLLRLVMSIVNMFLGTVS